MTRQNLPSGAPTALAGASLRVGHLFRLQFPSLTLYATSVGVEVSYLGQLYQPAAVVLSWGGFVESSDLKARGVQFSLAPRPDILAAVLQDNWTTSPVDVWLAVFNESFQIIGQPYALARDLRMSQATLDDGNDGTISLTCETGALDSVRDSLQIVSGPSHQQRYPGDTAFDRLAELRAKEVDWGGVIQRPGTSTDSPVNVPGRSGGYLGVPPGNGAAGGGYLGVPVGGRSGGAAAPGIPAPSPRAIPGRG